MPGSSRAQPRPAERAAARAISHFLDAILPPAARRDRELKQTPERAAEAWVRELADGYGEDPKAILAGGMRKAAGLISVTGIDFHSICPHHLLPYRGVAHVAYIPGKRVVGFGQIARLVDCFAHRLIIEEELCSSVAKALMKHVGAKGAACVLDAEQQCLSLRGPRKREARAHAECFVGAMRSPTLQRRFLARIRATR